MKTLIISTLIFCMSCGVVKDLPEAVLSRFELIAKREGQRGNDTIYIYTWFEDYNNVTYVVYSYKEYDFPIGYHMNALIRR